MKKIIIALFAVSLSFSMAAGGISAAGGNDPCWEDIEKFCSNVTPQRGLILICLENHMDELSELCKKHISDIKRGE